MAALSARAAGRQRASGRPSSCATLPARPGARLGRARVVDDVRAQRHRRRAARLGERGDLLIAEESTPTRSRSSCRRSDPRRAAGRDRRRNVDAHGTREVAERVPRSTSVTTEAQEIAARHHFRPRNEAVLATPPRDFPRSRSSRSTRPSAAGTRRSQAHFADGALFDRIYAPGRSDMSTPASTHGA